MIREDRDPAFWVGVVSHPAVSHTLSGLAPESIAGLLAEPNIPLRSDHGGFIFVKADSFGRAFELHTLFTPEGWGREVYHAAREAFDLMFSRCDLIITHETEHRQSRPPLTFRFARLGEFSETFLGPVRLWALTRDAWMSSPARRR